MHNTFPNSVLVAEDNEDVRHLLRAYLEMNEFSVFEAKNGLEAIEIARTERLDIILMDLCMPEVDGIQAIEEIRRDEKLAEIPILVVSAHGDKGIDLFTKIDKLGSGYIEYLTKPLNYRELANMINKIISQHQANLSV